MTISALVFDFDGVLVDSEPLHLRAYQVVLSSLGIQMTREEYFARYLGFDDEGVFRAFAADHGWTLNGAQIETLIAEKSRVMGRMLASTDVLYPGAAACVERVAGAFPLGIASGALRHEIEAVLDRARLRRHFRFIVAAGDTRLSKPSPDPYRLAATLHNVSPEFCAAIEDSQWGIESARAAGLMCIGLATTYPRDVLAGAHIVIDSLDELTVELIKSLA